MLKNVIDLLFPRPSLLGGESGRILSPDEWNVLQSEPIVEDWKQLRARGIAHLSCIRAGVDYQSSLLVRRAIHMLKYRRVTGCETLLAQFIVSAARTSRQMPQTLCPVPLHWSRRFSRGFNQSDLLAREVSSVLDVPVTHLLRRRRPTGHQMQRSRVERLVAVQDSFCFVEREVPRSVALIDDLATTGATLDACADALKSVGVEHVEGWVIAHG